MAKNRGITPALSARTIQSYLARYATPEHALAEVLPGAYSAVILVPSFAEEHELQHLLASLDHLDAPFAHPVLVIVVINEPCDASAKQRQSNQRTLQAMRALCPARKFDQAASFYIERPHCHWLVLDRTVTGQPFVGKQGVGWARKMAADVACGLWLRQKLHSRWIYSVDADVTVPRDYLLRTKDLADDVKACIFPFAHTLQNEPSSLAIAQYECFLRYYQAGLFAAKSPFAFFAFGSLLAISVDAYAQVRGFPDRQAGEDFYLLNKLAKLGKIEQLGGAAVELSSRPSDRVPFGTGPAVRKISALTEAEQDYMTYHPQIFAELGQALCAMKQFAQNEDTHVLTLHFSPNEIEAIRQATRGRPRKLAAAHEWFDGLRTLQWIRQRQTAQWPQVPLMTALQTAWFLPPELRAAPTLPPHETAIELCERLRQWQTGGHAIGVSCTW